MAKKKRGYSRAFTPKTERRVQIVVDRVPPTLKTAAVARAKRDGISIRALILGWLQAWANEPRSSAAWNDDDAPAPPPVQ